MVISQVTIGRFVRGTANHVVIGSGGKKLEQAFVESTVPQMIHGLAVPFPCPTKDSKCVRVHLFLSVAPNWHAFVARAWHCFHFQQEHFLSLVYQKVQPPEAMYSILKHMVERRVQIAAPAMYERSKIVDEADEHVCRYVFDLMPNAPFVFAAKYILHLSAVQLIGLPRVSRAAGKHDPVGQMHFWGRRILHGFECFQAHQDEVILRVQPHYQGVNGGHKDEHANGKPPPIDKKRGHGKGLNGTKRGRSKSDRNS